MTRIYTRTGDAGETGIIGGKRVSKTDPRVRAYGEVDELNAALGLARALGASRPCLGRLQEELFELGAELADPKGNPRIGRREVETLEREIDELAASLPEVKTFLLPGGGAAGAALHLARAACRRAERAVVELSARDQVSPLALHYLNRLSDHLFMQAREANRAEGREEKPWQPG